MTQSIWTSALCRRQSAIFAAENAPLVNNVSFVLQASEALSQTGNSGPFSVVEKLTATGDFANAEHVELTNIGTAANALVASNASEIDAYSLVTDFAGGTVSVDEAIAILAAENANAVTGKNSFTLKIQDDNAKIKSAINDSDGLAALQAADEVLAVGASASDTVAVVDSGSAANSWRPGRQSYGD